MTIIGRHTCLADSTERPGSYLDCDDCRDALIKSFGEPAGPPVWQEPENSMERSPMIGEMTEEQARHAAGFSEPVTEDDRVIPVGQVWVHQTTADTEPNEDGSQGGRWVVSCTCGWGQSGKYARDLGEAPSLRLAQLKGEEHELDPDKACAYCGYPHREGRCSFCARDNRYGR
jgi:hypothetical protein